MYKFTLFLFSIVSLFLHSQSENYSEIILKGKDAHSFISGSELVRLYPYTKVPAFIKFRGVSGIAEGQAELWLQRFAKFDENGGLKFVRKETDELGYTHYRYVQLYKGFEIFGTTYILHFKNGFLVSANGLLYDNVKIQNKVLTELECLNLALKFVNADVYKWQIPEEEAMARHEYEIEKIRKSPTYYPKGELKIIPQNGNFQTFNHDFRLSYVFDIYADEPVDRAEIFVDVETGEINFKNPLLLNIDANGRAKTVYSDTQNIRTDSISPIYFRLRETNRGNGVQTFNLNKGTNYGTATDFIDSNNFWNNVNANKDQFATDAHWGSEMTYDYFWLKHNRNSIDNAGFLLKSYIHYSTNYTNAFWDGVRMTYGDGAAPYTPLVAMDIAGHEIAHGLTSNTSGLIYSYESGALNESFSDIFGVAIDFYARPSLANYLMGDGIGGTPFRSMANPKLYSDPNCYLGNFWWSSAGDNGGVHTNSGVQNYWFYLMINGGVGKNDKNDSFWVQRLGIDTAAKIAFRNNVYYLTPSSQYADARFYAIQSAMDIYGPCSKAVISTTNAWHAVGVGSRFDSLVVADFTVNTTKGCSAPQVIRFTNLSNNGYTFKWKFGTGDSSSVLSPTYKYMNNGLYTVTLIADGGPCGIDTLIKANYIELDAHNDCIAYVGDTLTNQCFGTLYDDGGPYNGYNTDMTKSFTISPTAATSVAMRFIDFDVEPGTSPGNCNYDYVQLHNGSSTAGASLGKFCNTNRPSTASYNSGSSATVNMYSDPAVTGRGFELKWQCTVPNAKPSVRFSASTYSTCTGEVDFKDESYNAPTSWYWTFGDGGFSTNQHPSYVYQNSGTYNVRLIATNAFGSDTFTKMAYIVVNRPTPPMVVDTLKQRCGTGSVSFNASGSGLLQWFESNTSDSVVYTGSNFTTPSISSNKNYYVQSTVSNPLLNCGPLDTNIGAGGFHTAIPPAYLIFDADRPCKLISVKVRANSTKPRRFQLMNKLGAILDDTTILINVGTQVVNLNFDIPMGTDLRLGIHKDSSAGLYRNTAGATYPYQASGGLIKIKGHNFSSTAPTAYYYFYNWTVREADCKSARVKVSAKIQQSIVLKDLDTFNCGGSSILLAPSGNDIDSIYWITGGFSATSRAVSPSSTSSYIYSAFNSCGEFKDTATILSLNFPFFNFVSADTTICKGQNARLNAKGNSMPYWVNQGISDTSIVVAPTNTTLYPLQLQNACGIVRDTIIVTTVDTPNLTARTDTSICIGTSVTLFANSNFPITWYPMNVTSASVSVNPITQSYYYAEVNTSCGLKRDTVQVSVLTPPTLIASNDTTICIGTSAKLKAKSDLTPFWSSLGVSDTLVTVSPSTQTNYFVQVSNVCGIIKDTVVVYLQNKPIVSILDDSLVTCKGNTLTVNASSAHPIIWLPNGTLGATNTINPSTTMLYYATAQNDCGITKDSILLKVELNKPTLATNSDTAICRGQSMQLNANTNGNLLWNELGVSTSNVMVSPLNTVAYTLQSTNSCGISRDTIIVRVDTPLVLNLKNDTVACLGTLVRLNNTNALMIHWLPQGITTSSIYYVYANKPATYYATATNRCGVYRDSINIALTYKPTLSVSKDTQICPGSQIVLNASADAPVTWLGFTPGNSVTVKPYKRSSYIARASNQCGHTTANVLVDVFSMPEAKATGAANDKTLTFSNLSLHSSAYKWYFGDGDSSTILNPIHTYKNYGSYNMSLIASNQCGSDTIGMIVILKSTSSILDEDQSHIEVYPNPASSLLNIKLNDYAEFNARLFDMSGREIQLPLNSFSMDAKIDVSRLSKGNYMLMIQTNQKTYHYKILKD